MERQRDRDTEIWRERQRNAETEIKRQRDGDTDSAILIKAEKGQSFAQFNLV
jgi:hypothetical protein